MVTSVKKAVLATIHTIYCHGNGNVQKPGAELVRVNDPVDLLYALNRARSAIEFHSCVDVAAVKLNCIDPDDAFSPKREIMSVCKRLLIMKSPHGQRRWGIGISPAIESMLSRKTYQLIDDFIEDYQSAAMYFRSFNVSEMEFSFFVGSLVAAAIQVLPSDQTEFRRIYREIWVRRTNDKMFAKKLGQLEQSDFHERCIQAIEKTNTTSLPMSTFTWLEPSCWTELQKMHWDPEVFRQFPVNAKAQRAAFKAFMSLKKMFEGRQQGETNQVNEAIRDIINDVELTNYWLQLINAELTNYQQITCHDWCRLEGQEQKKTVKLVHVLHQFAKDENVISIRLAFLRLLLPLVESWVLCILLERQLRKETISQYISTGLKELQGYIKYAHADLLPVFCRLKQFAIPYHRGDFDERCNE